MGKTVKSFRNYDFENYDVEPKYYGDYPHANFYNGEFLPVARRELKKMAANMGAELTFNPGYFYYSAFFKKDDKCVYINVGDVRYDSNWYDKVLFRTAKNEKDYTGGPNRFCSYDNLENEVSSLLNRM